MSKQLETLYLTDIFDSTVNDLAKYDIALDRGEIDSESVKDKLFTPATASDGTSLPYAFGW